MKYGIRECCDVVLRAKGNQQIGKKIFYKDEPVCYFDTLKTSSLEGAATTVYAQGGRGNPRLMSWDGERTMTFTMEDALISPVGLAILTGAGLIEASAEEPIYQHVTETLQTGTGGAITLSNVPKKNSIVYIMKMDDSGDIASEPYYYEVDPNGGTNSKLLKEADNNYHDGDVYIVHTADKIVTEGVKIIADYYVERADALQINIEPEKFGGSYYLEASTLWRDQNGVDYPAEFIIPNCRVQSNFTFTMAGSGDPSTFTFTIDAFPGFTRWDSSKKVLAAIQILGANEDGQIEYYRVNTKSDDKIVDDVFNADPAYSEGASTRRGNANG